MQRYFVEKRPILPGQLNPHTVDSCWSSVQFGRLSCAGCVVTGQLFQNWKLHLCFFSFSFFVWVLLVYFVYLYCIWCVLYAISGFSEDAESVHVRSTRKELLKEFLTTSNLITRLKIIQYFFCLNYTFLWIFSRSKLKIFVGILFQKNLHGRKNWNIAFSKSLFFYFLNFRFVYAYLNKI